MREYRFTKYVCLAAMLYCMIVAIDQPTSGGFFWTMVQETAFTNALLFGCWFYLSDLRYRLCKEARGD